MDETTMKGSFGGSDIPGGRKGKSKLYLFLAIVVLVGGFLAYSKYQKPGEIKPGSPEEQAQIKAKVDATVAMVAKIMVLPSDDQPLLATITDATTLISQQPFFNGAEDGDVLLIYPKLAKAVIYSEKRNVIVNAGPVFNNPAQAATPTPAETPTPAPKR